MSQSCANEAVPEVEFVLTAGETALLAIVAPRPSEAISLVLAAISMRYPNRYPPSACHPFLREVTTCLDELRRRELGEIGSNASAVDMTAAFERILLLPQTMADLMKIQGYSTVIQTAMPVEKDVLIKVEALTGLTFVSPPSEPAES